MLESLLLLTDIIDKRISDTRHNLNYILVYDEKKNPRDSKMKIKEGISRAGTKQFARFGLEPFEKIYFKNVFTVTEEVFENQFVKDWTAS
ncbi:MAG: hypothetical protein FWE28_03900 [Oscillospiraceae bacterium]|nr:hypothetical protein [Oscillospiraceae bacterium]